MYINESIKKKKIHTNEMRTCKHFRKTLHFSSLLLERTSSPTMQFRKVKDFKRKTRFCYYVCMTGEATIDVIGGSTTPFDAADDDDAFA